MFSHFVEVFYTHWKGATGENFVEAREMLRRIIGNAAMHFQFLLQSEQLTEIERNRYKALINIDNTGIYTMSDEQDLQKYCCLFQFQKSILTYSYLGFFQNVLAA